MMDADNPAAMSFMLNTFFNLLDAFRQKGQVRCILLALPGEIPPKKRGKDRL